MSLTTFPPGGASSATTLRVREAVLFDASSGVQIGSISGTATTATMSEGTHGPHTLSVEYPAGWTTPAVTLTGPDRGGTSQSETFAVPGGGAGGVVQGSKVFDGTVTGASAGGGNGGLTAVIGIGIRVCLAHYPVAAIRSCSSLGAAWTMSSVDLALGTFEIGASVSTDTYHVLYEVSV